MSNPITESNLNWAVGAPDCGDRVVGGPTRRVGGRSGMLSKAAIIAFRLASADAWSSLL